MNYEILSAFILATSALAISPGPDNIFVLTQSITNGIKYGLSTTAGLISGCIVHTTLLAFGVSALIKENDQVFFIIKLFGASYLFFLAYKVYRTKAHITIDNAEIPKKSLSQLFRQGFTMKNTKEDFLDGFYHECAKSEGHYFLSCFFPRIPL